MQAVNTPFNIDTTSQSDSHVIVCLKAYFEDGMSTFPASGLVYTYTWLRDTSSGMPGDFAITGPVGVQTAKPNTITWAASSGADYYQFILSQQPDCSFPLYDEIVYTNSKSLSLNDGDYYACVNAVNANGQTPANNQPYLITVELPAAEQLMFVTGGRYFVSPVASYPPSSSTTFGSVLAADYHCTSIASTSGFLDAPWDGVTLHFRALLTEGAIDIRRRASMRQGIYYNTSGNIIANTVDDIMNGVRLAPVKTQSGVTLTGTQVVWTGANTDGTPGLKCNNWTQTTGSAQAGNLNGSGTNWLFQGNVNCNSQQRLYCVGDRN
jgi:hypothetical protein